MRKSKGRWRKLGPEGKVGLDEKSGSEGRQAEVRVQKGTVGEGRGDERSFVFPLSSLFCVEEGLTIEHVPVTGHSQ